MPAQTVAQTQQTITNILNSVQGAANRALENASEYTDNLSQLASQIVPPQINVPLLMPSTPPSARETPMPVLDPITFVAPPAPTVAYDDTLPALPDIGAAPVAPDITFGAAPDLPQRDIPAIPGVDDVTLPDAPVVTDLVAPSLLAITIGPAPTLNLPADFINDLQRPTMTLVAPAPTQYEVTLGGVRGLQTAIQSILTTRMQGGTGLAPEIEAAIWARESERERIATVTELDEIVREAEASGFNLPPGSVAAKLNEARQRNFDKSVQQSREIAIKQAELEQSNLDKALTMAIEVDKQAFDEAHKIALLAFDAHKTYIDQQIQVYNAGVQEFKALVDAYSAYVGVYKVLIEAEQAKVEIYKAQVQAEVARGEINSQRIEAFKALIQAQQSRVDLYKAQIEGVRAGVEVNKAQVEAAGEQVKAYVALVNADTLRLEAYKTQIEAGVAQGNVYKSQVDAYAAQAAVLNDSARLAIANVEARSKVAALRVEQYKALVEGEAERVKALAGVSENVVDLAKIAVQADTSYNEAAARFSEVAVRQAETVASFAQSQAKINADFQVTARQMALEASKVQAQVTNQVTAASIGVMHASASLSANSSDSVANSLSINENISFSGGDFPGFIY